MFKYIISENMKIKRTFAKRLMFIAPFMIIVFSTLMAGPYFQIDIYNWWYTIIFPGVLAVECLLLLNIDGKNKNKGVLSLNVNLKKVWVSKVVVAIKNITISCFLIFVAAQTSIYVSPFESISNINFINGFLAFIVMILTSMWLIPVYFYIGKKIGLFPSVIISMCAGIFSIITAVESWWWVNPLSYTARLMCPILKLLPNGLMAVKDSQTFKPELLEISQIPFAIVVSIILFAVFTYMTAKWYEKQEAR
ncbi:MULTISPECIES: lantibiotic immunity ABC transporter MutE/EpiE family permease subunit [Clostridium]|uniref:lantibiotic immunity ABC transporter MutE/EpiE family permease subunit n=1 Tax=Clostridium TaxID=1485 RepID=UPI0002D1D7F3|nr:MULTISPECIES: lantibiotic immunity ABC transporter MutE/EpiE family permease subunit [Clostridium]ENZ35279.1 MutE/EpiE family lantibiotic protection ABC transporter permease subunit [Clostridium butyricum 60E.3]KIU08117.1 antibiotic permease protein SpaE/mutE [Clostridium butyricum]KQB79497.1 bacteriocin ABC transporter permease [Clostridium butyricum]MBA8967957.1 ABC-2 type transport system permease protein [Clostridium butyricum]MBA8970988.1 ABC-2 type transport system permease protein [C